MKIEGLVSLRQGIPKGELLRLQHALTNMGVDHDEVVVRLKQSGYAPADQKRFKFGFYSEDTLDLTLKEPGKTSGYLCQLEFAEVSLELRGENFQRKLYRALDDLPDQLPTEVSKSSALARQQSRVNGDAHESETTDNDDEEDEVEETTESSLDSEAEPASTGKVRGHGYTKDAGEIKKLLALIAERHGDEPFTRDQITQAVCERVDTPAPGKLVSTLIDHGYFQLSTEGYRVYDDPSQLVRYAALAPEHAALHSDDPASIRLAKIAELLEANDNRRAGISRKQNRLVRMTAQRDDLNTKIAELEKEIEEDKNNLLSEDALAPIDELLSKLGAKSPVTEEVIGS